MSLRIFKNQIMFGMNEKAVFERMFRDELKDNRFKKYHIEEMLEITAPTLKKKIEDPQRFTIGEMLIMEENGIRFSEIIKSIFKVK